MARTSDDLSLRSIYKMTWMEFAKEADYYKAIAEWSAVRRIFTNTLLRTLFCVYVILLFIISILYFFAKFVSSRAARQVQVAPGFRLRKLAEFFFSRKIYEQIFEPTLRDLFDEYCEALKERRFWKARWVCIRGYWSFWAAVVAQAPVSIFKKVYQIWKAIP